MWIYNDQEDHKLIEEILKPIIEELAPEETDLFGYLLEQYQANPSPSGPKMQLKDDPIGFGPGDIVMAITPAATAALLAMLNYLRDQAGQQIFADGWTNARQKIKKWFKSQKESINPIEREQLIKIRQVAIRQAISYGLDKADAEKLADGIIGRLAIGN